MTDKTKVLGVRLPNEVEEWYKKQDARKILQSVYELCKYEILEIKDNEIVVVDSECRVNPI